MFDQRFYKKCSANKHKYSEISQLVLEEEGYCESDYVEKDEEMDDLEFYSVGEKDKVVNTSDYDEEIFDKMDQKLDTLIPMGLINRN